MLVFLVYGYNDGMYLKYGGKDISQIDNKEFSINIYNYILMEVILCTIVLLVGIILKNLIIIAFAFGILTYNILGYFKSFYQASGEFKLYGLSLNLEKISIFIGNLILIFIIKTNNEYLYIFLQIIVGIIVMIFLYFYLNKNMHFIKKGKISLKEIEKNIKSGFILMIGNFTSSMFTGIDRWFVKILMTSTSFAFYAFSVSVENMLNTFISPITISLYNDLCKDSNNEKVCKIKNYILLWIAFVIISVFPIKFILEKFLYNYYPAISIIVILFTAQVFYSVVNGIYVNLYKVNKEQKFYLKQMIIMIFISILLNLILYKIFASMNAIAFATLITACIWFCICEIRNYSIRFSKNSYIFLVIILLSFIISGLFLNSIYGFLVYIVVYFMSAIVFERRYFIEFITYIKEYIINKLRRNKINE